MTLIRELIDIPEQVHRGDFVLRLTQGVERIDETLGTYVVTPQLVSCFEHALSFIKSALETRSSKAAYLHGSFGSGKSHFMAVLHLLLRGNAQARSITELAPAVTKHDPWLGGKKFLLVPYHMIGARSLESAILGRYVEYVRELHPNAPLPGVYLAEDIFRDARRLRDQMGDTTFFAQLNGGREEATSSGWGELAATWDAERFEAAIVASPEAEDRVRLVGDLVDRYFQAYRNVAQGQGEAFVSLDQGLSIISRHAQGLGYDGLILFLDELILWLASNAADLHFVNREGQKLAKLVEAQSADRPIPIVSFVARQRDLRELVGSHITGAEELGFADILGHWEARFDMIRLEDRNLAKIAEKRLLKPKSEAARQQLDAAFIETQKVRDEVMQTLLTRGADREMFRQVYPFSPALVRTLVAVSSVLQRERTALKVMLQLLVDHRDTLALGDIVPVGDLFDVISEGDEAFSEGMKRHFENAKRLYHEKLLPLLEQDHGIRREEFQLLPWGDAKAQAFRADDRLVKTLLLSALVPEEEALKNLTPGRLAALNHGSIRSPIAGREGQMVLARVRKWAGQAGEIKLSEDSTNPTIAVQLSGVDTESILEKAKGEDNTGNRRRKIRELLFGLLGVADRDELWLTHEFPWRGTKRQCDVLYANVRELPDESLRSRGSTWKVVVDFPFDDPPHTPKDDVARIAQFRDERDPTCTLAWIPAFLSRDALADLGKLVRLDHVLKGERFDDYASHLSAIDRAAARSLLDNQRSSLRHRMTSYLEGAYGVDKPAPGSVDESHELADHVQSLDPTFSPRPPVGASLARAFQNLLEQALEHQYPGHPAFESDVRIGNLRKVYAEVQRAAQDPDGRVPIDKTLRLLVRQIASPLKLGDMSETHFVLGQYWRNHFLKKSAQDGGPITVEKLRKWIDDPQPRGLPKEVENLVIRVFADQTNRSFFLHGGPASAQLESLDDAIELREETLPPEDEWREALERAGGIFGLTSAQYRTAANVTELAGSVKQSAEVARADCERLARKLRDLGPQLGVEDASARVRTAGAAIALVEAVRAAKSSSIIGSLAGATIETSMQAIGSSIKKAGAVCAALESVKWQIIEAAVALPDPRGPAIRERIREALAADEYAVALAPVLRQAEQSAVDLITERAKAKDTTPKPKPPPGGRKSIVSDERQGLDRAQAQDLFRSLEKALKEDDTRRVDLRWDVYKPGDKQ